MRSTLMGRHASFCGAAAVLLLVSGGCARTFREDMVRQGMAGPSTSPTPPPHWVTGDPQLDDDSVYFVGRGVGYTILDERKAVEHARQDVLAQLASHVGTHVSNGTAFADTRRGAEAGFGAAFMNKIRPFDDHRQVRFLPGDEIAQSYAHAAGLFTTGIAGDLVVRDVYFEQWDVRAEKQGFFGLRDEGKIRYKAWVLMSIPREKLERRIDDFRKIVEDAYNRQVEDRERALAWAAEDREVLLRREQEDREWIRLLQEQQADEARTLRERILEATESKGFERSKGEGVHFRVIAN